MVPCSLSTYKALGSLPLKAFDSEYLSISFPNGTQTLVPNAWIDDLEAIMAFRSLKTKWKKKVDQAIPRLSVSWTDISRLFEGSGSLLARALAAAAYLYCWWPVHCCTASFH